MFDTTKRVLAAVAVAAFAVVGVSTAAQAGPKGPYEHAERFWNRDVDRVLDRDLGRIFEGAGDAVEASGDAIYQAGRAVNNALNPR